MDPEIITSSPNSAEIVDIYTQKHEASKEVDLPVPRSPTSNLFNPETSDNMMFSSSPVLYPPSSSPAPVIQKRKLFQTFPTKDASPKRPRILGGFIQDDDDDDSDGEAPPSFVDLVSGLEEPKVVSGRIEADSISKRVNASGDENHTRSRSPSLPPPIPFLRSRLTPKAIEIQTSSGKKINIAKRFRNVRQTYEQTIAQRSTTAPGRAKKAYYGIDIHKLIDDANIQKELDDAATEFKRQNEPAESVECAPAKVESKSKSNAHQMWTEKYRAKKFTELVGDERTHRSLLRWLKGWDSIVFPGTAKTKPKKIHEDQEQQHRKILLLTGPPGLGKTTLAHVCAKQAGYEVLEINASDDRSRDVVRGRIKDALGTETVRGIQQQGKARKAGRPVCVIVDEVDGVVTGSGGSGGEGGFMKALIDLVQLDQRNSHGSQSSNHSKKKGDKFRLMRPLILICNDVYAPSLRPLRQSSLAEIIHVRKPSIEKVIGRLRSIFDKENISCDNDAVRRLCESAWGLGTRKQNSMGGRGAGDGDIRGVLVQGEWLAHKLRATTTDATRMTRKWVEENISKSTASHDGLGRGGVKEVVERIFIEGAGLPNLPTTLSQDDVRQIAESKINPIGVADLRKRTAVNALRGMIDTTGDHDRLMTECFATYPTQVYQDDTLLSKPNASYEWLHFHDLLSSKIYAGQEWELNPYLSTSACGFHDLFATVDKGIKGWGEDKGQNDEADADVHPYSGLKADFTAYEAEKANRTILTEMQAGFSAPMLRLFSSVETIATELVPNVSRMLAPDVKPVVIGGSGGSASVASVRKDTEKNCVQSAVRVMHSLGIEFEKVKIESEGFGAHANGGWALRMEPPIDSLSTFHISKQSTTTNSTSLAKTTTTTTTTAPVRYAIRQVLSQELGKEKAIQANLSRQARAAGLSKSALSTHPSASDDKENNPPSAFKNLEQITGLAAATATLSSAPGSVTVLNGVGNGTVKKDFFGRPKVGAVDSARPSSRGAGGSVNHSRKQSLNTTSSGNSHGMGNADAGIVGGQRTWVSFHEGYSNAVRKYIGLRELMDGF